MGVRKREREEEWRTGAGKNEGRGSAGKSEEPVQKMRSIAGSAEKDTWRERRAEKLGVVSKEPLQI